MISFQVDKSVRLVKCGSALTPSGLYDIDFALNPYIGCSHGCLYCYSPDILRCDRAIEWGNWVNAKVNISRILRNEASRLKGETVGLSTVTDPYQPVEEKLELSRSCLNILRNADFSLILMTKSPLVLRDFDILQELRNVELCVTITTLDKRMTSMLEPRAPSVDSRLEVLEKASESDIKTLTMVSPLLVSSDDPNQEIFELIDRISQTGCENISFDTLRLRPTARQRIESLYSGKTSSQLKNLASIIENSTGLNISKILRSIAAEKRFPLIKFDISDIN